MGRMRVLLVSSVVVLLVAGPATAGVVGFSIGGTWSQGAGSGDITATPVSLGGAGSFTLDPGFSDSYFDFTFGGGGTFSTTGIDIFGYYFLRSYTAGETVGLGNFGDDVSVLGDWDTILVEDTTSGVWGASHSGYLGFRADGGEYGWIDYDFVRAGGVSTLTLNDGAYESVAGTGILIPGAPVPEPSSVALFGIGTLAAAFFATRRRRRNLDSSR